MEKWDKNQWANSYKGSVLTSTGEELLSQGDYELEGFGNDMEQDYDWDYSKYL